MAGANIEGDSVNAHSKVAVIIDGKEVLDPKKIVSALRKNDEIKKSSLSAEKSAIQYAIKDSDDSKYPNFIELIDSLVDEMNEKKELSA